jgi:hypothetical protein
MRIIVLFLTIFLFGCGFGTNTQHSENKVAYSLDKFKPVLQISKLQAPTSKYNPKYSTKYGEFKDVYNKFFYLQDGKYMTFYMCQTNEDDYNRSELRFKNDFKVSSQIEHIMEAKVKIFPLDQQKEFTFLQIHSDDNVKDSPKINKPLLRIAWRKEYNNINDHLWAVIRLENDGEYDKIDLGKRPITFFYVTIKIKDSQLSVFVNGKKKIDNFDVSYWDKYYNYFKAGVYLQGFGCVKVLFDKLSIK